MSGVLKVQGRIGFLFSDVIVEIKLPEESVNSKIPRAPLGKAVIKPMAFITCK